MVILDTNIIIDHLRSSSKTPSLLLKLSQTQPKETLAISIITIQELYSGQSTKNINKEKDLLAVISPLKILPFTFETAQLAGQITRDLPHDIELADAAIAASAIINNCPIFTLNTRDFASIPILTLYKFPN